MCSQSCTMSRIANFVLLFIYVSGLSGLETNETDSNVTVSCVREHEYDKLDYRKVLGKWNVVEVYPHLTYEGVNNYNTCPDIMIWEVSDFPRSTYGPSTEHQLYHVQHIQARFRQEYRHLRLLWNENGQMTEYALFFKNDSAGYWHVFDGQNGTMTTLPNYQQFSGTVQVLKAVSNHLVLNFCQEGINGRSGQLYSVLLSRTPGDMNRWEIEAIHSMLQNKKLSVASRRMVCGNSGADRPFYSLLFSFVTCLMAYVIGA